MGHQPYLVICTDFEVVVDKKTSQGSKLRTIRLGNAYNIWFSFSFNFALNLLKNFFVTLDRLCKPSNPLLENV